MWTEVSLPDPHPHQGSLGRTFEQDSLRRVLRVNEKHLMVRLFLLSITLMVIAFACDNPSSTITIATSLPTPEGREQVVIPHPELDEDVYDIQELCHHLTSQGYSVKGKLQYIPDSGNTIEVVEGWICMSYDKAYPDGEPPVITLPP